MFDISILTTEYYGNSIIQWIIALSLIVIFILLSRSVHWLLEWLKKLSSKTKTNLDDLFLEGITSPMSFIILLLGFRFSLGTLTLSSTIKDGVNGAFHFCFALTFSWLVVRVYQNIHKHYLMPLSERTDTSFDNQLLPVFKLSVQFMAWSLGIIVGLNNAGYDVGAVLAGLGIGGLAFALAAQDTVSNLFGGITILIQRPFSVGDRIEVEDIDGWVKEIGLRSSVIENFEGQQFFVPNKTFTENTVKNIDAQSAYYIETTLLIRQDMSLEKIKLAMALLKEILTENKMIEDKFWCFFDGIGEYAFTINLRYGIKLWQAEEDDGQDNMSGWYYKIGSVKTEINLAILSTFQMHDIKLALPLGLEGVPPEHKPNSIFH